jgi:hypothetical protein
MNSFFARLKTKHFIIISPGAYVFSAKHKLAIFTTGRDRNVKFFCSLRRNQIQILFTSSENSYKDWDAPVIVKFLQAHVKGMKKIFLLICPGASTILGI